MESTFGKESEHFDTITKLVAGKDYTCAVCRNEKLEKVQHMIVHFSEELCMS